MLAAAIEVVPVLAAPRIVTVSDELAVPVAVMFTASFSAVLVAPATLVALSLML
jgi:hypothetical protein